MANLCLGCMLQKSQSPVCEHCGFDERRENLPHQLPMGTILQNQYLVGRVLGQGGFGITYIGWDQHLSIPVAIKEYFPGGVVQRNTRWSTDVMCATGEAPELFEKHKSRFLKEARTLAQLSGIPEIVQIKSFFPENGTAYIVMEYVEGITLKDHMKKLGRSLTEEEALAIMEPVLEALQKVHDQGLIHRDISPDNIMLPKSGGVKLIDFGTVRYMDDSGKSKSTEAVLKPGFAPMEQYNTHGNLGTWTDVYAICATFHYLLTGKVPADVHARLEQGESLSVLRNREGISKKLIVALEKGMKLRAQERVQTIAELHQLLYTGKKRPAVPKQKEAKEPVPEKKEKKKGKGGLLAACAAAVVALGAAAMLLIPGKQASKPEIAVPEATGFSPQTTVPEASVPETEDPTSPESMAYAEAEQLLAEGDTGRAAIAFGKLAGYKDARERSMALWKTLPRNTFDVSSGTIIGLREDGTVAVAFSAARNEESSTNQERCAEDVSGWQDIVSVSMKNGIFTGLKCDGTVVASATYELPYYQEEKFTQIASWQDIVYLDCNTAVKADGSVVGFNFSSEWGPDDIAGWTDIKMISSSPSHIEGLKADGTVITAGRCGYCTELNFYSWTDVVYIEEGHHYAVGLRSDGTVLMTGFGDGRELAAKQWTHITAIRLGGGHTVGLKSDGTVVAAGYDMDGRCSVSEWTDVVAIDAGGSCTVGLRSDGSFLYAGPEDSMPEGFLEWKDIQSPSGSGKQPEDSIDQAAAYAAAERLLAEGDAARAAIAFGKLGDYEDARQRSLDLWALVTHRDTVSAAHNFTVAILEDGSGKLLQGNLPDGGEGAAVWAHISPWRNLVSISASDSHIVGLQADGTVLAKGNDNCYDLSVLKNVVAIATGRNHTVGLKPDGTVVASGANEYGQCNTSGWNDIIAIDAAASFTVALKADGTVVAVGDNTYHQCDVSDWTDIVAVRAGLDRTLGIRSDGTLVTTKGATNITVPQNLSVDVLDLGANWTHIFVVQTDGSLKGAFIGGTSHRHETDYVAISVCDTHFAGLREDGTLFISQGWGHVNQLKFKLPTQKKPW